MLGRVGVAIRANLKPFQNACFVADGRPVFLTSKRDAWAASFKTVEENLLICLPLLRFKVKVA
jgi:hypothetical protein